MEQTSFDLLSDDKNLPNGFRYWPNFLSIEEETQLLEVLKNLDWQLVRMHGVIARRRVVHFGLDYEYNSWKTSDGPRIPREFEPLVSRACEVLKIPRNEIAALLAKYYPTGAGIGWHRDAPMFGPSVFGVSLAGACTMKFRRRDKSDGTKIELASRSAYVIGDESRTEWQHSITPVAFDRYSITIRTRNPNWKS